MFDKILFIGHVFQLVKSFTYFNSQFVSSIVFPSEDN